VPAMAGIYNNGGNGSSARVVFVPTT
jgi:hypothetical protein